MHRLLLILVTVTVLGAGSVAAQGAPAAAPAAPPLDVGAVAPDFAIPGATRYGVLKDPVKLSDFKGKTVVLAFFFKARTRG
jgi:peroxiredoxin Q/BCP